MSVPDNKKAVEIALQSSLRLHPKRVELGKAELLTDALLHPFDDLDRRLNTYISGAAGGEKLRKGMQSYLSRLNANPMIPLHFRLKVLKRFEDQLDLFDAEMTAAILNAHKIGIDMVQKEAQEEPAYYRILVDMVSHAVELAGRLMRDTLSAYEPPAVITIRQVFDLMRLGMIVLPSLPEDAVAEKKRLYLAIVRYELLRNLDFYSRTKPQQGMVMDELKHHIKSLIPHYLPKTDVKSTVVKGHCLLASNLNRPHDTAQVMPFLPSTSAADFIVIPMDDFIDRLVSSIDRAERVLKNPVLQSSDLQIEESLHTTIVGGNAILDALRMKSRVADRQEYGNAKVVAGWSLTQSILDIQKSMEKTDSLDQASEEDEKHVPGAWSVMNISRTGLAAERMSMEKPEMGVGAMIGMHWKPHRGEPALAFIRWIRYPKLGEQKVGLEFYQRPHVIVRAAMLSVGDTKKHRSWPVLATFEDDGIHTILFPDKLIFKGMVFSIVDDAMGGFFKIMNVRSTGPNYSICRARRASELDTKSLDKGMSV
ncbi:MAG: hypothetical protein R8M45_00735 [Ghiorsea sp.]